MKKLMLSLAVCGMIVYTAVQANAMNLPTNPSSIYQDDEKIDPENLPEQVKESIKKDDKMKKRKISEAKTERKDNKMVYVVKFEKDESGEEMTKKFDAMGNEVSKDEDGPKQRKPGQQQRPAQQQQQSPQQGSPQQGTPGNTPPNL